jgi:hypothetical protein
VNTCLILLYLYVADPITVLFVPSLLFSSPHLPPDCLACLLCRWQRRQITDSDTGSWIDEGLVTSTATGDSYNVCSQRIFLLLVIYLYLAQAIDPNLVIGMFMERYASRRIVHFFIFVVEQMVPNGGYLSEASGLASNFNRVFKPVLTGSSLD